MSNTRQERGERETCLDGRESEARREEEEETKLAKVGKLKLRRTKLTTKKAKYSTEPISDKIKRETHYPAIKAFLWTIVSVYISTYIYIA